MPIVGVKSRHFTKLVPNSELRDPKTCEAPQERKLTWFRKQWRCWSWEVWWPPEQCCLGGFWSSRDRNPWGQTTSSSSSEESDHFHPTSVTTLRRRSGRGTCRTHSCHLGQTFGLICSLKFNGIYWLIISTFRGNIYNGEKFAVKVQTETLMNNYFWKT